MNFYASLNSFVFLLIDISLKYVGAPGSDIFVQRSLQMLDRNDDKSMYCAPKTFSYLFCIVAWCIILLKDKTSGNVLCMEE